MTDVLYAAEGGSLGTSDLFTLDPVTAVATSIGPTGFALTGLVFDPTDSTLFGATTPQSSSDPKSLVAVDPATGAGTLVGAFSPSVVIADIAFDSTGQLYGWDQTNHALVLIDKATGALTATGPSGISTLGDGMDFNSSDVLYGIFNQTTGDLYTVNPTTGALTVVVPLDGSALPNNNTAPAASFLAGVMWILVSGGDCELATVDVVSGVISFVGTVSPAGGKWDALAWTRTVTPPPPGPTRRFFSGYPWRFVVTDLNSETITFLDRLATGRQVTVGRNIAREARGLVPSDNPEINIRHTDGDPFLNEGNRLIYGFRREGWNGSVGPWVCRFAGPLLHLEDNAQTDAPASPWIAQDPWAKLYRVPVRLSNGDLPGADGRVFLAADLWTYPEIALQLLLDSITYDGTCFIDPTGGTVTAGPVITEDVTLQQGLSVGQAWDQLCATGKVDIELDPVYDPVGSPGICAVLVAKPTIGVTQNAAIFAWDLPSRSLTDISRVIDGTGRANTIQYYLGQGGPPVSVQIDAASKAKYGEYWEQQFWPGFRQAGPVNAMAARRLALVKDGVRTFTFAPAPERSPIPFDDYMPGDWAPFFASKKLRAVLQPTLASGQWTNIPRIESFTVDIADNQTETVNPLLVSMDIQP